MWQTFPNPQFDIHDQEEIWDFRVLQLPLLYSPPNHLYDADLLVLQGDYSFMMNPELPVESSAMVRLVGSRVPCSQANQLSTVAAVSRPTSSRPPNKFMESAQMHFLELVSILVGL